MTPSIRCADFIKSFEKCRLGAASSLNLVNEGFRYPKARRYLALRRSSRPHFENLRQVFVAQLDLRVRVALPDTATSPVLPRRIFGPANPFKVFKDIVRTISIQMVHGRPLEPSRYEGGRNHAVNVLPYFLGARSRLDGKIAGIPKLWAKNAAGPSLLNLERTRAWRVVIKGSHAALVGNLKSIFPAGHRQPNLCHAHLDRGILR